MAHNLHSRKLKLTAQIDSRSLRTRETFRNALLSLLKRKALADISVRDLSVASGIAYSTFFRHYATRESLLNDVAATEIERMVGVSLPVLQATGDLRSTTLALCRYVYEHRALWSRMLAEDTVGAMRNEFIRIGRNVAKEFSAPKHWLPPEVAAVIVIASTIELFAWWLAEKNPMSVEAVAKIYERIIITPTVTSDDGTWLAERRTEIVPVKRHATQKKQTARKSKSRSQD